MKFRFAVGCFDSKRISETVPVNDSAPTEWTGQDIRRLSDTDQIQPPIPGIQESENRKQKRL